MLLTNQRKTSTAACKWYQDLPENEENKKQDYGREKYKTLSEHEKKKKKGLVDNGKIFIKYGKAEPLYKERVTDVFWLATI